MILIVRLELSGQGLEGQTSCGAWNSLEQQTSVPPKMPFKLLLKNYKKHVEFSSCLRYLMKTVFVQDSCLSRDYWVHLWYKLPEGLTWPEISENHTVNRCWCKIPLESVFHAEGQTDQVLWGLPLYRIWWAELFKRAYKISNTKLGTEVNIYLEWEWNLEQIVNFKKKKDDKYPKQKSIKVTYFLLISFLKRIYEIFSFFFVSGYCLITSSCDNNFAISLSIEVIEIIQPYLHHVWWKFILLLMTAGMHTTCNFTYVFLLFIYCYKFVHTDTGILFLLLPINKRKETLLGLYNYKCCIYQV